jgi:hypothetical protein
VNCALVSLLIFE